MWTPGCVSDGRYNLAVADRQDEILRHLMRSVPCDLSPNATMIGDNTGSASRCVALERLPQWGGKACGEHTLCRVLRGCCLNNCERLVLSGMPLGALPGGLDGLFAELHAVVYLDLRDTGLGVADESRRSRRQLAANHDLHVDTFRNMTKLRIVDLSHNQLSRMPADLFAHNRDLHALYVHR